MINSKVNCFNLKKVLLCLASLFFFSCNDNSPSKIANAFNDLNTTDNLELVSTTPLKFNTHHPQGIVKIDKFYYLSTVEVIKPTVKYDTPKDGYDRTPGEGQGYLQKFDINGKLITSIQLGEGNIYHPGGIDYDGKFIYVPVAEYRPNSASIIYQVDPKTMRAKKLFSYADHIGGVVKAKNSSHIHAVSWGSRRFYTFEISNKGLKTPIPTNPFSLATENKSYYIDYQDAKHLDKNTAIFSGIKEYQFKGQDIAVGGLELRKLDKDHTILKQLPVKMLTNRGKLMTGNPFDIELDKNGLFFYFVPDDNDSMLYIYKSTFTKTN